jgi:hypothetical protein
MSYVLEFIIAGLPKTPNQLLGAHWTIRAGHARRWKSHVAKAVTLNGGPPKAPLRHSLITCVRISSGQMDRDGLSGSFKSLIDGLKACGVIVDDSPEHVEIKYAQEKGKRGEGRVRVRIEEIGSDQINAADKSITDNKTENHGGEK